MTLTSRSIARGPALAALVCFALLCAGCAPRALLLQGVADQLAGQGQAEEEDLGLARDAAAFYLKLSESVLQQTPDHTGLAEAVGSGFTQYAYAFVAFEADKLEATDSRAAQRLRQRAARLYERAHRHTMRTLELQQPGFAAALAARADTRPASAAAGKPAAPLKLAPQHVALAYWAAASWGGFIALSKDKPDVVADLPLAMQLAQLAYDTQPEHGQGSLAVLMAQFELARPGGTPAAAERYLAVADRATGAPTAATLVARAESLALPAGDRAAFEQHLRQALAASADRRDLANQVLRARAQWLLDTLDDRF